MSDKLICLVCVNYCLWFSKEKEEIDEVIDSLHVDGDKYNWESNEVKIQTINEMLGFEMTSVDDRKRFKMTQYGMINKILKTCGTEDCKFRQNTTAMISPLGTDSIGKGARLKYE